MKLSENQKKNMNALQAYDSIVNACIDHFEMRNHGLLISRMRRENKPIELEIKRQEELTKIYSEKRTIWCQSMFQSQFPHLHKTILGQSLLGLVESNKLSFK